MSKRFYKHKILLDENMPPRAEFPRLNDHFDVKHLRDDLKHGGLDDPEVYQLATQQGRIVITFNGDDFRDLPGTLTADPGVIDAPSGWRNTQLDTKLTALLMHHNANYFARQFRVLATEQP